MRVLGLLVFTLCSRGWAAPGVCESTAEGAVRALTSPVTISSEDKGFRVAALRSDALRRQTWALVEICGRPDLPRVAVRVPHGSLLVESAPSARLPVVHIGDEVTVTARTGASQMVLRGWAEESGARDAKVRIRLPRLSDDDSLPPPKIACRVTGAGSVEVEP